jgi:hypothetical protein
MHPGQGLALFGQFVAAPGQFLLGLQQLESCGEPFLASACRVFGHGDSPCLMMG